MSLVRRGSIEEVAHEYEIMLTVGVPQGHIQLFYPDDEYIEKAQRIKADVLLKYEETVSSMGPNLNKLLDKVTRDHLEKNRKNREDANKFFEDEIQRLQTNFVVCTRNKVISDPTMSIQDLKTIIIEGKKSAIDYFTNTWKRGNMAFFEIILNKLVGSLENGGVSILQKHKPIIEFVKDAKDLLNYTIHWAGKIPVRYYKARSMERFEQLKGKLAHFEGEFRLKLERVFTEFESLSYWINIADYPSTTKALYGRVHYLVIAEINNCPPNEFNVKIRSTLRPTSILKRKKNLSVGVDQLTPTDGNSSSASVTVVIGGCSANLNTSSQSRMAVMPESRSSYYSTENRPEWNATSNTRYVMEEPDQRNSSVQNEPDSTMNLNSPDQEIVRRRSTRIVSRSMNADVRRQLFSNDHTTTTTRDERNPPNPSVAAVHSSDSNTLQVKRMRTVGFAGDANSINSARQADGSVSELITTGTSILSCSIS